jgi:CysZ protein
MKNFFSDLFLGYKNYIKAIRFVFTHRMYMYFFIPLLLMMGIYLFGRWVVSKQFAPDIHSIHHMSDIIWYAFGQHWLEIMGTVISKFSKYLVVVLLSPMFALLSEKVEEMLTKNRYPFKLQQTFNDVKRGIRIVVRNMMWEYFFFIVVLGLVAFFDGGLRATLFFSIPLAIGFFYYGFSFIDYINERRRLNVEQSVFFVRKHRGLAVAIGSVYSLLFLLPIDFHAMLDFSAVFVSPLEAIKSILFNFMAWLIVSAAPILAIITATLSMHELVDLSGNEYALKEAEDEELKPTSPGL